MKYIVYQTLNKVNNKIYIGVHKCEDPEVFDGYLGCGVNISVPSSYMKPCTPFQYAVKKYGTSNFVRTTLRIFDNEEDAYKLERELVTKDFLYRKDNYNVKVGGIGGNSYYFKLYQFDFDYNFIREWNTITEAAEFYNVHHSSIWRAVTFKTTALNFYWSKKSKISPEEYNRNACSEKKICYQYNLDGKLINIYSSILEAAKENSINNSQIRTAIQSGYRVGKYYYTTKLYEEYTGNTRLHTKNKTIYIYTVKGDFVIGLKGYKEVLNFFNIKYMSPILKALRAKKSYQGYQFSLEKVDKMSEIIDVRQIKKKVGRFSLTGELLEEYNSITEARNIYGNSIKNCLNGRQKQCKGFIFKYI